VGVHTYHSSPQYTLKNHYFLEIRWLFRKLKSNQLQMSRKKKENEKIRKKYQVTGEQLIKEGKIYPHYHLQDWVDIKEEQLKTKTDWWERMS